MIIRKTYDSHYVRLKATGDQGIVSAVVSVWNNVDLQGDRAIQGMFAKSLARWAASGDRIPAVFSHEWLDPMAHIGYVMSARETSEGLEVVVKFDIESNPQAAQVFRLLKERRITEWSFAYDTVRERKADDGANELLEVDLIEVGPTIKAANPLTRTIAAKNTSPAGTATVAWNDPRRFERVLDNQEADLRRREALKYSPAYWNRVLDRLAQPGSGGYVAPGAEPIDVDAFVTAVRQEMVEEKLAEAEQAAWEERMGANMVLDPVPVRVDSRMRPDW